MKPLMPRKAGSGSAGKNILIIGYGTMGRAIANTLAKDKGFSVFAYDKHQNKVTASKIGYVRLAEINKFDAIFVAVKPQDVPELARQLKGKINPRSILFSIAAGMRIKKLFAHFNHKKIVRLMPNLGLAVGQGIAVWKAEGLLAKDKKIADRIQNRISENFEVQNENLIDAATAISGSGPAYFFFMADVMIAAALRLGLSAPQSRKLVQKTLAAAAALQGSGDYRELIAKIRSKKGTTDAALKIFQKRGLGKIVIQGAAAAYGRAQQLSK